MSDGERRGLIDEPLVPAHAATGQNGVEHHGVHATQHQIAVRMHIILVGDRDDAVASLRVDEQVVGKRRAERRDAVAAEIAQGAVLVRVRRPHGQHFAELVVRNGDREPGAARRTVLDAAQPDVEITARRRGIDAGEADLNEARRPFKARRE